MSSSNIQPPRPNSAVVTIIDPKLLEEMKRVKADTEAILAKMQTAPNDQPRYFPRGYFG